MRPFIVIEDDVIKIGRHKYDIFPGRLSLEVLKPAKPTRPRLADLIEPAPIAEWP